MKKSEILKQAWSMHRGQPKQRPIYCDYLCNIIAMDFTLQEGQSLECRKAITNSLKGSSKYEELFCRQFPQYRGEDWEFYKHSEFYLTEKGKWVQSLIEQLEKEEQELIVEQGVIAFIFSSDDMVN